MKKMNKKGFTLVELLAVIVVLAFIMVLAAPSVISSMNSARQSSFMLYAEKMLNSAQSRYQADQLITLVDSTKCYPLTELSDSKSTQYIGYIQVENGTSQSATYKITMMDKNFVVGLAPSTGDTATNYPDLAKQSGGLQFNEIEQLKSLLVDGKSLQATKGRTSITNPCDSNLSVSFDNPSGTTAAAGGTD